MGYKERIISMDTTSHNLVKGQLLRYFLKVSGCQTDTKDNLTGYIKKCRNFWELKSEIVFLIVRMSSMATYVDIIINLNHVSGTSLHVLAINHETSKVKIIVCYFVHKNRTSSD